jgi:hypothetical protein
VTGLAVTLGGQLTLIPPTLCKPRTHLLPKNLINHNTSSIACYNLVSVLSTMTRRWVYWTGLGAFTAATVMLLVSIASPDWVGYHTRTTAGDPVYRRIGLHQSCTNVPLYACGTFPDEALCRRGGERGFCDAWRTVGFLANLAAVVHFAAVVALVVVMAGGKLQRERGWPVVGGLLGVAAVVEAVIVGVVAYLYEHDAQFLVDGWALDHSWYLCLASAVVAALVGGGVVASAHFLPPEDGYAFLDDSAA